MCIPSRKNGRKASIGSIAVLAIIALLATSAAQAQWRPFGGDQKKTMQATGISWDLSQAYSESQVSANAQTMTTRLPPATSITNSFQGRFGKV